MECMLPSGEISTNKNIVLDRWKDCFSGLLNPAPSFLVDKKLDAEVKQPQSPNKMEQSKPGKSCG